MDILTGDEQSLEAQDAELSERDEVSVEDQVVVTVGNSLSFVK